MPEGSTSPSSSPAGYSPTIGFLGTSSIESIPLGKIYLYKMLLEPVAMSAGIHASQTPASIHMSSGTGTAMRVDFWFSTSKDGALGSTEIWHSYRMTAETEQKLEMTAEKGTYFASSFAALLLLVMTFVPVTLYTGCPRNIATWAQTIWQLAVAKWAIPVAQLH
jgi:hypothetical protein